MNKFWRADISKTTKKFVIAAIVGMLTLFPSVSFADDWIAEQLRGRVFMFEAGQWVPLLRGDIVSDDRVIRTTGGGRVTFVRGNETIEVSKQTQIRIVDSTQTRFTTVMQDFGTIVVEAEVERVQHFSVVTPLLAAVLKGTRFSVTVDEESTVVNVTRGLVQVRDTQNKIMTNVSPGQRAKREAGAILQVSGGGTKAPMTTYDGKVVDDPRVVENSTQTGDDAQGTASASQQGNNGNGNGNSGNNGNGNGNSGNNGNGNGNSGNNGNGNGNSGNNGNGNGNSGNNGNGNGNSGNNGNGNGNNGNGNS